ncbi:hypothetical protein LINPERPRIM_LOCUS30524, partial [Linum perenne]
EEKSYDQEVLELDCSGSRSCFRASSSCQVLVASARLERQLTVEFEKVICWNHEVKIGDLLGVDLILYFIIFQLTMSFGLGILL